MKHEGKIDPLVELPKHVLENFATQIATPEPLAILRQGKARSHACPHKQRERLGLELQLFLDGGDSQRSLDADPPGPECQVSKGSRSQCPLRTLLTAEHPVPASSLVLVPDPSRARPQIVRRRQGGDELRAFLERSFLDQGLSIDHRVRL
jgi:hypothetical protein